MDDKRALRGVYISLGLWIMVAVVSFLLNRLIPNLLRLSSGMTIPALLGYLAGIMAAASLIRVLTEWLLMHQRKPLVEGTMLGRLFQLVAILAVALTLAFGIGKLSTVGQFFTLFGGLILGWSLQAPVSGFAAWALISAMRPFRPGDRVQFPSLGLTGDVKDIGVMYTVLNQVGGSIGSEEAVGRNILVPNAMLFGQVAINYTVLQGAAYLLDEVVVRMTYDSNWAEAEKILLQAAVNVTGDAIQVTGEKPYIRADPYDYGVYLRLRYQTPAKQRAETAYEINREIFNAIQCTPSVDLAIPFVYSYRSGLDRKEELAGRDREAASVREIPMERIRALGTPVDPTDVEQVALSIAARGLLQPIVVEEDAEGFYNVLAGDLRFEACRQLGWKTIRAEVRPVGPPERTTPSAG